MPLVLNLDSGSRAAKKESCFLPRQVLVEIARSNPELKKHGVTQQMVDPLPSNPGAESASWIFWREGII